MEKNFSKNRIRPIVVDSFTFSFVILFLYASILGNEAFAVESSDDCIPMSVMVPLDKGADFHPQYSRVHPSGRYLLFTEDSSNNGQTILVDFFDLKKTGEAKLRLTGLNGEAFPVEPSWDFISGPNHSDGMRYVPFDDILLFGSRAKPAFSDPEHNEYYQSIGELPGSNRSKRKFRTLLYNGRVTRDYEVTKKGVGFVVQKSKSYKICEKIEGVEVSKEVFELEKNLDELARRYYKSGSEEERKQIREESLRAREQLERLDVDPLMKMNSLDQPRISKNAKEVAGNLRGSTVIYEILDKATCRKKEKLSGLNSKVDFSYPIDGESRYLAYTKYVTIQKDENNSWQGDVPIVYDRRTKKEVILAKSQNIAGSFPNFTKDGRIIYFSGDKKSFYIVDPNQIRDGVGSSSCIKRSSLPPGTPEKFGRRSFGSKGGEPPPRERSEM